MLKSCLHARSNSASTGVGTDEAAGTASVVEVATDGVGDVGCLVD